MGPEKFAARREEEIKSAIELVISKQASIREAAKEFRLPRSTLHLRIKNARNPKPKTRRTWWTEEEEECLVCTLLYNANRGVPLTRKHLIKAVGCLLERLLAARRDEINSKDGIPRMKFNYNFEERHKARIKLSLPKKHESARVAATNSII